MMLCATHSEHRLYLRVQLSKKYCCVQARYAVAGALQDSPIGDGALLKPNRLILFVCKEGAQRLIVKVITLVLCLYNSILSCAYPVVLLKDSSFWCYFGQRNGERAVRCRQSLKVLCLVRRRQSLAVLYFTLTPRIVKGFFFLVLFWATKRGILLKITPCSLTLCS